MKLKKILQVEQTAQSLAHYISTLKGSKELCLVVSDKVTSDSVCQILSRYPDRKKLSGISLTIVKLK